MDSSNLSKKACPVGRGIACVGDAWTLLILRDASRGLGRFDQFRTSLNIAPSMLTRRLAYLTEEGLLEKRRYSEKPPRDEYVLTEAGRDFVPVLVALGEWGRRHRGGGKVNRFVDVETSKELRPVVIDAVTKAEIGSRPFTMVGPK